MFFFLLRVSLARTLYTLVFLLWGFTSGNYRLFALLRGNG